MDNFIKMANKAIVDAMDEPESKKGDSEMLVITNAGYGQIDNRGFLGLSIIHLVPSF